QADAVGSLVETVPAVTVGDLAGDPAGELAVDLAGARERFDADAGLDVVVTVDSAGCPTHLVRPSLRDGDPTGELQVVPVSLRVRPAASVVEVATRAMTRVTARRFDPVLCVDDGGRLLGLVRPERMTLRLAALQGGASPADVP
ncbi:hypothetical protein A7K94_0216175, partial [Modestobacter sp. VKM Ac-2676]